MREILGNKFLEQIYGGGPQPMPPVQVIGMESSWESQTSNLFSFGVVGGTGINISDRPLFLKILNEYDYARNYFNHNPADVPTLGTITVTAANVNVGRICQNESGVSDGFDPVLYNDGKGNLTIGCGFNLSGKQFAINILEATGDQSLINELMPYVGLSPTQAAAKGLAPVYITQQQADELTQATIQNSINEVTSLYPGLSKLPTQIATALVDADFHLGLGGFESLVGGNLGAGNWSAIATIFINNADSRIQQDGNLIEAYLKLNGLGGSGGGYNP